MDPLSDVLALLEARSYGAGSFQLSPRLAVQFRKHEGIKCYAVASGQCWLSVEGFAEPSLLAAGDCFVLPRGLPFRLATDLSLVPIDTEELRRARAAVGEPSFVEGKGPYLVGGYFHLEGHHAFIGGNPSSARSSFTARSTSAVSPDGTSRKRSAP